MLSRVLPGGPRGAAKIGLLAACVLALAAFYLFAEARQGRAEDHARDADAVFGRVAEQWEAQASRDDLLTDRDMQDFAEARNLRWGIVQVGEGGQLRGDIDLEWLPAVVEDATESGASKRDVEPVRSGPHGGQLQATYAVPIRGVTDRQGREVEDTALVFNGFYTEGDPKGAD